MKISSILVLLMFCFLNFGCRTPDHSISQGHFALLSVDARNKDQLDAYAKVIQQEKRSMSSEEIKVSPSTVEPKVATTWFGEIWSSLMGMLGIFKDGKFEILSIGWDYEQKECQTNQVEIIHD